MRQRPLCSDGRFRSRVELSCTVVGALLCSVLLCSALLSVLYTALHCCQSRRRRQVSLCPRERELLRSAAANFARSSAEQRGRRENRAALLVASCTKSGRAEWTGELDREMVGGGRWEEGSPDPRPLSTAVHTATNLHAIRPTMSFLSRYS